MYYWEVMSRTSSAACTDSSADAMAVMTSALEVDTHQKEEESGATSTGVDEVDEWMSSLMMISLAEDGPEPDNPELRNMQNDMSMPRTWQKVMTLLWLTSSQKSTLC